MNLGAVIDADVPRVHIYGCTERKGEEEIIREFPHSWLFGTAREKKREREGREGDEK